MKTRHPVNQLLTVPKDPEGEYFLHLLDKYMNHKDYAIKKRGRTPDKKKMKKEGKNPRHYPDHTPLDYAQNYGIYLITKYNNQVLGVNTSLAADDYRERYFKQSGREQKIRSIKAQIEGLYNNIKDI